MSNHQPKTPRTTAPPGRYHATEELLARVHHVDALFVNLNDEVATLAAEHALNYQEDRTPQP